MRLRMGHDLDVKASGITCIHECFQFTNRFQDSQVDSHPPSLRILLEETQTRRWHSPMQRWSAK